MKLNIKQFVNKQIKAIRKQVGKEKVICALSGGVDSSVAFKTMEKVRKGPYL